MPKAKVPPRVKAAYKRVDAALRHVDNAIREVKAAQADLSRVVGAPGLAGLVYDISHEQRKLMLYIGDQDAKCELDHDPTPQELRCGHGPRHGCGKGKR